MTESEIIEKLKSNLAKFYHLPIEERDYLRHKAGKDNCLRLTDVGYWLSLNEECEFSEAGIYRLKPDYQPEPKKPQEVKCKIVKIAYNSPPFFKLGFYKESRNYLLYEITCFPNYSHCEDKYGNHRNIFCIAKFMRVEPDNEFYVVFEE